MCTLPGSRPVTCREQPRYSLIMLPLRRAWWYITVLCAAWTGLMKPYVIAFEAHPGQRCGAAVQVHLQRSLSSCG